jgi:hypothetical protein
MRVPNPNNPKPEYNNTPGGNDTTDKIFFLSIQEAENADLRFSSDSDRIAKNTDYTATRHSAMSNSGAEDYWWLRSPGNEVYRAVCVYTDGRVLSNGNNVDLPGRAVRPAFCLDLSSVFFTSAAAGGKAATVGSDLADAETAAGDIKFTIFDAAQTLTVDKSNLPQPGATLAFSYSGAKSGANQFVSCVLEREGKVEYYGKLVEADSASAASGTLYVPMTGVADGAYTLKIFSEQVNDDYLTDFAGTPEIMNLTVDGGTAAVSAKIDSPPEENGVSGGCDTGAAGLLLLTGMVLMGVKNRRV